MRTSIAALALLPLLAAGCATGLEPHLPSAPAAGFDLVDMSRVNATQYRTDYEQCVAIANQDAVDVGRATAGLVASAAEKASLGVIGGKPSRHADRMTVVKRCLTGRGYQVLR